MKLIKLQGELNTTFVEACENIMSAFRDNLKALMEEHVVGEQLVFNTDQSALYFKRFPCTTIIAKYQSNYVKVTKSVKSKDRITEMVCKYINGKKFPMAYVGKSKQPKCFKNADGNGSNHRYTSNKTVWFNRGVTQWWFQYLFSPCFNESFKVDYNEESHCIMIMDGCSAHN